MAIKDPIVEEVKADLDARSAKGVKKYGTTVADNPAPLGEWLQHAYEEALDHALYLKRAMKEVGTGPTPWKIRERIKVSTPKIDPVHPNDRQPGF